MKELAGIVKRAQSVVPGIAADLTKMGGILRCTGDCGCQQKLTEEQSARYLRYGWPKCCGYTMRWVTQRELDEEAAGADPR